MFGSFIKVSYMIWWRMMLFAVITYSWNLSSPLTPYIDFLSNSMTVFFLPLVVSGILVFGFKKTLLIFPIIRFLFSHNHSAIESIYRNPSRNSYPRNRRRYDNSNQRIKKRRYKGQEKTANDTLYKSTSNGYFTGYENLDDVTIDLNSSFINGVPGSGLDSSGFKQENIKAGQKGELNFAKALQITDMQGKLIPENSRNLKNNDILSNVNTFWSMNLPSKESNPRRIIKDSYDADVDMIFAFKKSLILVDLKLYKGGDVTYQTRKDGKLYIIDNATKKLIGYHPRKMSKNMQIATERYKQIFPQLKIDSYIVLVPTKSGVGTINNVYWPGNIKLYNMHEILPIIFPKTNQSADPEVLRKLRKLVK